MGLSTNGVANRFVFTTKIEQERGGRMIDLSGKRFGRLIVIEKDKSDCKKGLSWLCECDCGNRCIVWGIYLRNGDTKSCGCLHKDVVSKQMSTHGLSKTRLYRIWSNIKTRCYNPNSDNYKYYGGKGIYMCDEWKNNFLCFRDWAINNGWNEELSKQDWTIDRIDNSKPYCPENCRWANHITQCNNQTSNKMFEYNNEVHTMSEWARILGIKYTTLRARISRGHTFEEAITM